MVATLTYGRQKPADGDKGQTVFDALEANIDLDDSHTHNGTDSAKIPASSLTKTVQTISSGGWSLVANGIYKQNVVITGGLAFDNYDIQFRDTSDNSIVYLKAVKTATSAYDVYTNDNTLNLKAVYS